MKNSWLNFTALMLLLFFSACSTQQNTWVSRHYQELNTRYNVYFNAKESYKQGLNILKAGNPDNYTSLLPMYSVSNHSIAKISSTTMNKTIEKCQKAIKQRSIRVKPSRKPTSRSRDSYKKFYAQEEFNPYMDEVFLLMANAQFHMADFNSSAATCTYIIRHFSSNKIVCDKASILLARSYKELEWLYDAENLFRELNTPSLTPSLNGDYAAAYADYLIAVKKYAEAIPFLELAVKNSRNNIDKQRWTFLLAQLYQEQGQKNQAYTIYGRIPGMSPPYPMEISARILQTEVFPGSNTSTPLRKLKRMSRSTKNRDYMDQIHYAMGNLYLAAGDTTKAFENYQMALDKSTRFGTTKLKINLSYGDLLYRKDLFIKANACYSKAVSQLKKDDERYELAASRYDILKSLTPQLTTIHYEDSLLQIAVLPQTTLNLIVDSLVEGAEKKAREERRKKNAAESLNRNQESGQQETVEQPQATDPTDKSWYFYNPSVVSRGQGEFQKKWGKRELADDWRRNRKTPAFETLTKTTVQTDSSTSISARKDSLDVTSDSVSVQVDNYKEGSDNPLNRNYYLKNIPFTPQQKQAAGERIASALLKAGILYREQMGSDRLALKTFGELERRYPESKELEMAWYISYLMFKQANKNPEAEDARFKLTAAYPDSELSRRLSDSLFIEHLAEMYRVQDSLYRETYRHYTLQHEDSVFSNTQLVRNRYPLTDLMPRFLFLESLELGRIGQDSAFYDTLTVLVKKYPKSDVVPVAKSILALWKKGMRPAVSKGYVSLLDKKEGVRRKDEQQTDSLVTKLTFTPETSHVLLIAYPEDSVNANRLQFDVALYNFTTFLIRDYDLKLVKVGQMNVLLIQGFEDATDVMRYLSWIHFQNQPPTAKYPGIRLMAVSTKNLELLEQGLDPDIYMDFFNDHYTAIQPNP